MKTELDDIKEWMDWLEYRGLDGLVTRYRKLLAVVEACIGAKESLEDIGYPAILEALAPLLESSKEGGGTDARPNAS